MTIEVVTQKAERSLAYREHTTMDHIVAVMDKGLHAVYNHLQSLGQQPTGAPYAAYSKVNETESFAEFDLEIGFPVAEEVPVGEGLTMSGTYEGRVVTATHQGAYSTLETTYCAVMDYIKEHSLEPVGVYYDHYLNDPSTVPEDKLLTKVVIPVK